MKTCLSVRCSDKDNVPDRDPQWWLNRIESAVISPEKVIKAQRLKTTLKVDIPPWGKVCLQIYRWDIRRVILSPFRKSRGERIWSFSDDLLKMKISNPEPVFFLEIRKSIFVTRTYIATRWIDGISLGKLAFDRDISHDFDFKSKLLSGVDICARLHNSGFVHGDLKWSNFLCVEGDDPDVMLTDLDFIKRYISPSSQGRDFARFILSALEYRSDPELEEMLIDLYLKGRNSTSALTEKGIRKRISGKRKKYEGRLVASCKR